MFKSVQILFVLALTLGFAACSPGGDDGGKLREAPTWDYNTKSCLYDVTEGTSADFSLLGTSQISTMYFEKEINLAYLTAISKANIDTSIQFINQTGATIYKADAIKSSECSKPLFAQGQNLTTDLASIWSKESASDSDTKGFILGFYLAKNNYSVLPSVRNSAAIVIRENTNRWTLVHEFMHHLFELRDDELGYEDNQNIKDSDRALNDMDAILEAGLSFANLPDYAEAFSRYAKTVDADLVHHTLEEMTIESAMKDATTAGSLQYAPPSTNFYINSNGDKGLKTLVALEERANRLKTALGKSNPVELAKIESVLATIEARRTEILSLMAKYPYELKKNEANPAIYAKEVAESGCSHGKDADRILAQVRGLKKMDLVLKK